MVSIVVGASAVLLTNCADLKQNESSAWRETLLPTQEPLATVGSNTYFLLEPGYQLVLAGEEDGKKTELTVTVLKETQKIGDVETRVLEESETVGGRQVEVSRNFIAFGTQTKNIYYFGEDVDVYKGGKVVHEGAWRAGTSGATYGILLPGDIKIGERYYQEKAPKVAMDRAENAATNISVQTPAGIFANCLRTKETSPLEAGTSYKYYAPGIGLVQDGELKLIRQRKLQE